MRENVGLNLGIDFKVGGVGSMDKPQVPFIKSLSSASELGSITCRETGHVAEEVQDAVGLSSCRTQRARGGHLSQ